MFIDGSFRENKDWCGIVVPFWNCRPSLELHSREARRQTKGKTQRLWKGEVGEREEKSSGDGVSDSYALHYELLSSLLLR
jgi:hypothetical protein